MSWNSPFPGQIMRKTEYDHMIDIGGINYHYREYPGKKEKVVLLHGFASSTYSWEQIDRRLSRLGYHVFALDMKGFGWSDKPTGADYNPETLMEEVRAWMEELGLRGVTFVGNSLGGGIASLLAFSYPDLIKRLVLVDAGGFRMKLPYIIRLFNAPFAREVGRIIFGRWIVRLILKEVFYHGKWVSDEQVEEYYQRMSTFNAVGSQISFARTIDFDLYELYMRRLNEIKQKTLILWGREDAWIPLEHGFRFQNELPNAELIVIPECGHIPQEEKPEIVLRLIHDFIAGKKLVAVAAELGVLMP